MIFNAIEKLVKPETIWRLKYGQIVMVVSRDEKFVYVLNQGDNQTSAQYLAVFYEATLIG